MASFGLELLFPGLIKDFKNKRRFSFPVLQVNNKVFRFYWAKRILHYS